MEIFYRGPSALPSGTFPLSSHAVLCLAHSAQLTGPFSVLGFTKFLSISGTLHCCFFCPSTRNFLLLVICVAGSFSTFRAQLKLPPWRVFSGPLMAPVTLCYAFLFISFLALITISNYLAYLSVYFIVYLPPDYNNSG